MKSKIANQFLANYIMAFLLSLLAAFFAYLLLSFADSVISNTLVKNRYPAREIMQDDYTKIDAAPVVENGGGIQVINENYEIVYSKGLSVFDKSHLTAGEFTEFLVYSKSKGVPYSFDILYNEKGKFWLVVTFPTSLRLDLSLVYNKKEASRDMKNVAGVFIAVIIFYMLLLAVFAVIFSRITSLRITGPLQKLRDSTQRLREGDYSARVDLNLKNEFKELQDTFNAMADRIENEIELRRQSEENRKRMILDISHDLKNPLSGITGYAELSLKKAETLADEPGIIKEISDYLRIILRNSQRANKLINGLFDLSRVESPEYRLNLRKTDMCEYMRQICGDLLPALEKADFTYQFDIPDGTAYAMVDPEQLSRVFHNLAENAVRYNAAGTTVFVSMYEEPGRIVIIFKDNGKGIPANKAGNILKPFVRGDDSRNSRTGGAGLGLSIADRIIYLHNGAFTLQNDNGSGCSFKIVLPSV